MHAGRHLPEEAQQRGQAAGRCAYAEHGKAQAAGKYGLVVIGLAGVLRGLAFFFHRVCLSARLR
jgi:hypothetical protein